MNGVFVPGESAQDERSRTVSEGDSRNLSPDRWRTSPRNWLRSRRLFLATFLFFLAQSGAFALTNGLATRPIMGWAIWYSPFQWNWNWDFFLSNQVRAANLNGIQAAGYTYFELDDCWWTNRDAGGHIIPVGFKFPGGVAAITNTINYVHSLGLKFGIYDTGGNSSGACAFLGQTGALGHEEQDANDFANWGVDLIKFDISWIEEPLEPVVEAFTRAVLATGRPMVITSGKGTGMLDWYPNYMNSARYALDSNGIWENVLTAIDEAESLAHHTKPGYWNDPDYLLIGLTNIATFPIDVTFTRQKSQFAMWCLLSAPLMLSCDLEKISPEVLSIVTNPEMIAIDQDDGCRQGRRISRLPGNEGTLEVWSKPLGPIGASNAVVLFNRSSEPAYISFSQDEVGMTNTAVVAVRDAWNRVDAGTFSGSFGAKVQPDSTMTYVLTEKRPTPPPPPTLRIGLVDGQVVISWPASEGTFALQMRDSFEAPWTANTDIPFLMGGEYFVTNRMDQTARFFQLRGTQP